MADQATRAMQPQDAFRELAGVTLADHSVVTVMERIASVTKRTVPGADEVSVTLVDRGEATSVAYTGRLAIDLDERQYERGHGPCLDSILGGEPVRIDSMSTEQRWRDWTAEAAEQGAGSSLSIPVPVQRDVSAALNVYSVKEHAFDDASVELALTFAAYAGVALANMHLYQAQGAVAQQLQEAMESRAVIEQAKGMVMRDRGCNAEDAHDVLVRLSQTTDRELRDVAQSLVDEVTGARTG